MFKKPDSSKKYGTLHGDKTAQCAIYDAPNLIYEAKRKRIFTLVQYECMSNEAYSLKYEFDFDYKSYKKKNLDRELVFFVEINNNRHQAISYDPNPMPLLYTLTNTFLFKPKKHAIVKLCAEFPKGELMICRRAVLLEY